MCDGSAPGKFCRARCRTHTHTQTHAHTYARTQVEIISDSRTNLESPRLANQFEPLHQNEPLHQFEPLHTE